MSAGVMPDFSLEEAGRDGRLPLAVARERVSRAIAAARVHTMEEE